MNFFKMLWLSSEERKILKEAKERKLSSSTIPPQTKYVEEFNYQTRVRPYKNVYYSNKTLTVVFDDGTVLSKSGVDFDGFAKVRDCNTKLEIEDLMRENVPIPISSDLDSIKEKEEVDNNLSVLVNHPDFEVIGKNVYMKGVSLAIPYIVAVSFIEILEKMEGTDGDKQKLQDEYIALKMFWLKLALNSLPQSREDLLTFVKANDIRLTKNGNLILYRRIVTVGQNNIGLVKFISNEYFKLKREGKHPKEYAVMQDNNGIYRSTLAIDVIPSNLPLVVGNLQVLYLNLPDYEDNQFTSYHNRGKMSIKIGGIYKIPETDINLDNGLCAAGGLHAAAVNYNYSGFGDTPIVVLVNPSKAITVPKGDIGKLRTTEMFIACVNDKPHGVHFDDGSLLGFDEEYHDLSLSELEEVVKTKSFNTLSIKENVPAVSLVDLNVIKSMLDSRIVNIC